MVGRKSRVTGQTRGAIHCAPVGLGSADGSPLVTTDHTAQFAADASCLVPAPHAKPIGWPVTGSTENAPGEHSDGRNPEPVFDSLPVFESMLDL
jgi:hypothetical protein